MAKTVGIDLGTSNSVLAWSKGGSHVELVSIEQRIGPREFARDVLLPSVLFAPLAREVESAAWEKNIDDAYVVGAWAHRRAVDAPDRGIRSAKSWLSSTHADRTRGILPWASRDAELERRSPVEASAAVLRHLVRSLREEDIDPSKAAVTLTVPASFDDVARELTVQAADQAGLSVRLLEEPLAAFYDYLRERGILELQEISAGEPLTVLVVDVGGGTTDLTLVAVTPRPGAPPELDRVAVGRHMLLGGDNMDLALAHAVERAYLREQPSTAMFHRLVFACRSAKEALLAGESGALSFPLAVAGEGARLVGGTLRVDVSASLVRETVLEGFFPRVALSEEVHKRQSALVAFGLPYETDPAITRHLAAFLHAHRESVRGRLAVLLMLASPEAQRSTDRCWPAKAPAWVQAVRVLTS